MCYIKRPRMWLRGLFIHANHPTIDMHSSREDATGLQPIFIYPILQYKHITNDLCVNLRQHHPGHARLAITLDELNQTLPIKGTPWSRDKQGNCNSYTLSHAPCRVTPPFLSRTSPPHPLPLSPPLTPSHPLAYPPPLLPRAKTRPIEPQRTERNDPKVQKHKHLCRSLSHHRPVIS